MSNLIADKNLQCDYCDELIEQGMEYFLLGERICCRNCWDNREIELPEEPDECVFESLD